MKQHVHKWLVICLTTLLGCSTGWAQSVAITGQVTAAGDKAPLPGTTVSLKGTTTGTTTDASGNYRISVTNRENAILVFSSVGYLGQEITVGNQSVINVDLVVDSRQLDEVVVVGYGTVKKSDLTGSLAQVKAKELNAFPATNVLQALSGRATGVQVIQNNGSPGGSVSVRIRGTSSIQGSNEPLYVIDGFPINGSNPTQLNNADIESMEILKDASATAIYGSRGANGVVLITTKRGKAGRTQVSYDGSYSVQTLRKKLDLMNAREFATFYNEQAVNDKVTPYFTQDQINALGNGYDWQDLVFRKAPMQNHSLNISGGSDKTQFSIGGSVFKQDGIIKSSDYNRYSLRANVNSEISRKLSFNLSTMLTRVITNQQNSGGGNRGGTLISAVITAYPTLTPYNDDGTYRNLATAYPWGSNVLTNPLNFLNEQTARTLSNKQLANAALIYKPIPALSIKISGGIENNDDRSDSYTTRNFVNSQGSASVSTTQFTSLLSENTVTYNKSFGKHTVSALAGFTYQDFLTTTLGASGTGFISDASQTYDIGSAGTPGIPASSYSKASLLSYLGRVNYNFGDRYLATVSFRADGSSRYSDGNKWGYFPSGALAWRVSNEDFFKDIRFMSDLKLRVGYGATGSQAISPYSTLNQLGSGKTVFDDALYTYYAPGTRLPGNLKWETTEQTDIGLDAAFLNNRLRLTADYYIKNTRDLLNTVQLPSSLGFTNTIQNVGKIQNKGVELGLDGDLLTGPFRWSVSGNISFNRNKVVKLYGGQDILGSAINTSAVNDYVNILREGQPVGQFYGYVEDGYDDKGKIKYKDLDGDGTISAKDKTYIGNPNPRFIYGFNSTMSYKNFDFTFFFQGSQGNDIFNISSIGLLDYGFGLNMTRDVYNNHWSTTNPNPSAKYPIISRTTSVNISNRFVENGSYLRLRTVQLAYNIPFQKLNVSWISNAQIYVSGQNLLTFTKYSWWDPEINSLGGSNSITQGIDFYSYPTAKTVTVGIRAGF
ncbi:TonB-dependent receptor [Spirosoma aureum]|uniref:TonB-dependent receptor n=1 Tax=Spirosoma aureum TaxID=2692134 RepID=A0A6G9AKJ1_9BACT|nr:TonB-dependent receptor [Spirosoma aureum]QIP12713.1 TonB-dependent receptor [Spirosoma aureum]